MKGAEIDMAIMKNLQRGVASRLMNQMNTPSATPQQLGFDME